MKPRDVEGLLRFLLPALSLGVAGCDSSETKPVATTAAAESKPEVTPKPEVDPRPKPDPEVDPKGDADGGGPAAETGRAAASDDGENDGEAPVGEATQGPSDTGEELPVPADKPPRIERRMTPSCQKGTTCITKVEAEAFASAGKPDKLGCPSELTRKTVPGPGPRWSIGGRSGTVALDDEATKAKQTAADAKTCCYAWVGACKGGRPLLDASSQPVVAPFEAGRAWTRESFALDVPASVRGEAAAQWLADAATEHASVASFGRVALELMALGAPPQLLAQTHEAALDEIRHAQTCLAIAVACGAESVQPGPLSVGAPRVASFERLAVDTFVEGCIGETTAALMMERAAAVAVDPSLRQALSGIASDEARHAALAWRTVRWAVSEGGQAIVRVVQDKARELAPGDIGSPPASPNDASLAMAGRLSARALDAARRDAWHGLIAPMLAELARESNATA